MADDMAEPAKLQWLTLFSCVGMALFGWVGAIPRFLT
jgi:hypothetical protein